MAEPGNLSLTLGVNLSTEAKSLLEAINKGVKVGGGEAEAGAGGGEKSKKGSEGIIGAIKGLNVGPIAVGIALIAAFFDAVGPILKLVLKVLSAVILILLMPFLRLFIPLLQVGIPLLISTATTISDWLSKIFDAFKLPDAIKKLAEGDIIGFFSALISGAVDVMKIVTSWFPSGIDVGKWIIEQLNKQPVDRESVMFKIGEFIGSIIGTVQAKWDSAKQLFDQLWPIAEERLKEFVKNIPTKVDALWNSIVATVNGWKDSIISKLKSGVNAVLEVIFGGLNAIINTLKQISITIPKISVTLFGKTASAGPWGVAPFAGLTPLSIPKLDTGGFIEKTGLAVVHKGETVVPVGGGGGQTVNYSPTYNISADVDGQALKKMLQEHDREFLGRLRQYGATGNRFLST